MESLAQVSWNFVILGNFVIESDGLMGGLI